jgi:hypothetical protein
MNRNRLINRRAASIYELSSPQYARCRALSDSCGLAALTALPEILERVTDIGVPVPFFNFALHSFDGTGIDDKCHASTFSTYDVVVVALWIHQFVVATGAVQINFLCDIQVLQDCHYAKNGRVIRCLNALARPELDFVKRKWSFSFEHRLKDLDAILGNAHPMPPQEIDDRIQRKLVQWILIRACRLSHEEYVNLIEPPKTIKRALERAGKVIPRILQTTNEQLQSIPA